MIARTELIKRIEQADKSELIDIAGQLNNLPEHIHTDKVTIIALLDLQSSRDHVLKMLKNTRGLKID